MQTMVLDYKMMKERGGEMGKKKKAEFSIDE